MNSAMTGANLSQTLMPSAAGKSHSLASGNSSNSSDAIDFSELFEGEMLTLEGMYRLEQFMSPEQIAGLQSFLASGKALPASADLAEGNLLGNPALLQLMTQLSGEATTIEGLATGDSATKSQGLQFSLADIKSMLLRQGGGKGEGALSDQAGKPFNPSLMAGKVEIPLELQAIKPTLLSTDISAVLTQGSSSSTHGSFSALMNGLEQLSTQRADSLNPPSVAVPMGGKGWDNVLGNRIMWMVGNQMQQASLQITPRHLGPIDIQVSVQNDQTSVSFVAQNAITKEALEAAIPRLREMFSDSNLQLVNVDVGHREAGSERSGSDLLAQGDEGGGNQGPMLSDGKEMEDHAGPQALQLDAGIGLVDDYA